MIDTPAWIKLISSGLGWLQNLLHWLKGWAKGRAASKPLRFVPDDQMSRWIGGASIGTKPAMQVTSRWFVANLSSDYVRIVQVTLTRRLPRAHWWSVRGECQVTPTNAFSFLARGRAAGQVIAPNQRLDLQATFFVTDPLRAGESLRATTTFVDGGQTVKLRTTYKG